VVYRQTEVDVDPVLGLIPRMATVVKVYLLWSNKAEGVGPTGGPRSDAVWQGGPDGMASPMWLRLLDEIHDYKVLAEQILEFDSPNMTASEITEVTVGVPSYNWQGQAKHFKLHAKLNHVIDYEEPPPDNERRIVAGGAFYLCAVSSAYSPLVEQAVMRTQCEARIRFDDSRTN